MKTTTALNQKTAMTPIEADSTEPVKKKWTPEPWELEPPAHVTSHWQIFSADSTRIAQVTRNPGEDLANAERIVACVNGCKNVPNPAAIDAVVEALKLAKKRHVDVEYIESGTFQGGEEDTYLAKIDYNEECVVVSKAVFKKLMSALKAIKEEQP